MYFLLVTVLNVNNTALYNCVCMGGEREGKGKGSRLWGNGSYVFKGKWEIGKWENGVKAVYV